MDPARPGCAYDDGDVHARHRRARHEVALLDVDGTALPFALDVVIDLGNDRLVRAAQAVECRVERPRADGHPVAVAAQAEQQVVVALGRVHHRPDHGLGRMGVPVHLDQLLDARHDVARVVKHRHVGVEGEVSQRHEATEPGVGSDALCGCHRHCGSTGPARSCHRHEVAAPSACGVSGDGVGSLVGDVDDTDADRVCLECVEQVVASEIAREDSGRAERQPIARCPTVVHHDDRART